MFKKIYTTLRDNSIVALLQHLHLPVFAQGYNWFTTSTSDVVIFMTLAKMGIKTIEAKYLTIIIISFLL